MTFRLWSSVVLLAVSIAAVEATKSLQLTLSGPTDISDIDHFTCVTTLKNTGDEKLKLFNEPRGVLNPIATKSFKVAKAGGDGAVAEFNGLVAKYSFSHATSFTELAPGESVDVQHDLSKAYSFESTGPGTYTVAPEDTRFFYQDPTTGEAVPIYADVVNGSHTAKISGNLKSRAVERRLKRHAQSRRAAEKQSRSLHKRAIQVTNCASSLKNDVILSAQVASLYVADAEKYLTLVTGASERFTTWFGDLDQSNHDRVLQHYTNIRTSDLKTYTLDCECTESSDVFAYVFPDEFGHIHLCNQYIAANVAGSDSKAGTLVHESTHFTKNGGTKDLAYGKTKCMALAASNSTAATMNADSHEYFAENAPAMT